MKKMSKKLKEEIDVRISRIEKYRDDPDRMAEEVDELNELFNVYHKVAYAESEQTHKWVNTAITISSLVIPSVITIWGTLVCLKFEQTGTVTTIPGRAFTNGLFKFKK